MKSFDINSIVKKRPLIVVSIKTPITEVIKLMIKNRITAVCVARRWKLVGIFTMKDMMKKVISKKSTSIWREPKKLKIKDVPIRMLMTEDPIVATKRYNLHSALELMRENKIRHLPILDGNEVVGIVTLRDVIESVRLHSIGNKEEAKLYKPLESMYSENLYLDLKPVRIKSI